MESVTIRISERLKWMTPRVADRCLCTRYKNGDLETAVLVYVDDILIMSKKPIVLQKGKETFNRSF